MEVSYHPKSLKEFYHLKALITLEQVNASVVEKNLNEPNFRGEANWSSVVNFHCYANESCDEHAADIFGSD